MRLSYQTTGDGRYENRGGETMRRLLASIIPLSLALTACVADEEGAHGVRGQVLETITLAPLAGVVVSIGDDEVGWLSTTTDEQGRFELLEFDLTSTRMRLDGRTISRAGVRYPVVTTRLHDEWLQEGRVVRLEAPKYLPRLDENSATDLTSLLIPSTDPDHPAEDGWQQVDPAAEPVRIVSENALVPGQVGPDGEPLYTTVYAEIAPGSYIKFPEGEAPIVSATQVPVDQLPHQLPDYVSPMMMVTFQPSGTQIDPPAQLAFGDTRGYAAEAPDMPFTVWSLSHSMALFLELGNASLREGPFGPEIASAEGVGLKELGWHGSVCTSVNFKGNLEIAEDGAKYSPQSNTFSMSVQGGGAGGAVFRSVRNTGSLIESGMMSTCGGIFHLEYTHPGSSSPIVYDVPGWRCARQANTNDIGTFTIDLSSGTPQLSVSFGLSSC
jgi:hypothetical protein